MNNAHVILPTFSMFIGRDPAQHPSAPWPPPWPSPSPWQPVAWALGRPPASCPLVSLPGAKPQTGGHGLDALSENSEENPQNLMVFIIIFMNFPCERAIWIHLGSMGPIFRHTHMKLGAKGYCKRQDLNWWKKVFRKQSKIKTSQCNVVNSIPWTIPKSSPFLWVVCLPSPNGSCLL